MKGRKGEGRGEKGREGERRKEKKVWEAGMEKMGREEKERDIR